LSNRSRRKAARAAIALALAAGGAVAAVGSLPHTQLLVGWTLLAAALAWTVAGVLAWLVYAVPRRMPSPRA
jgi:hypothetical protein